MIFNHPNSIHCALIFEESATHATMFELKYTIRLDLGQGSAESRFITYDLTAEYVAVMRITS